MSTIGDPGAASSSPSARLPRIVRRLAFAALAFLVTDLIVGLAVFSVAILAIFAAFAVGWITLFSEYSAHSMAFGTVEQLRLAQALLFVAPALMAIVVYLGLRALRIPRWIWHRGDGAPPPGLPSMAVTVVAPPSPPPRMSEAALWAARGHPARPDVLFVSLQVRQE